MGSVLRGVGVLLHVPALMALLSLPVCLLTGEREGIGGFLVAAAVALTGGQPLFWAFRGAPAPQRFHAMQIAALSWLAVSVVGALPLWISAAGAPPAVEGALAVLRSPWHALFESVSGFTSTGLTILAEPSTLPAHLQWWRSFMQWVGGIGVVLLLLSVLPADRSALMLYYSEAREEKILPTVASTVRWIWMLYLGLTAASILLLLAVGEPFWRALNHGMTAIATGGFTITDESIAAMPTSVQLAFVPIMIAGALSFIVHYRLWRERRVGDALWGSSEVRLFWVMLAGGLAVLALELWLEGADDRLMTALFQWTSALTSAGFASDDIRAWAAGPLVLLLLAVMVGGMAGSTAGGVKVVRVSVLLHDLQANLRVLRATRHEVVRVTLDGRRMSPSEMAGIARSAALLLGAFLLLWFIGVLVLLHLLPQAGALEHVFFDAASALFNSGLSTGVVSADLSPAALVVFSLMMLLGRLEIFPIIVLLAWLMDR